MTELQPKLIVAGTFDSINAFPDMYKSPLRTVQYYELEYYSKKSPVSEINGIEYPRRAGSILIARPGYIRRSELPFQTHYIYLSDVCGSLKQVLDNLPPIINSDDPDRDLNTFLRIQKLFVSADPTDELAMLGEIFTFVHRLNSLKAFSVSENQHADFTPILQAQQFIDAHYSEPLTVQKIAEECHVSVSFLHKAFSETLGTSPHAVLLNRRITQARALLAHTDLPLCEVAFRCGFQSQAYFSDCFKKKVGVSPRIFRMNTVYEL